MAKDHNTDPPFVTVKVENIDDNLYSEKNLAVVVLIQNLVDTKRRLSIKTNNGPEHNSFPDATFYKTEKIIVLNHFNDDAGGKPPKGLTNFDSYPTSISTRIVDRNKIMTFLLIDPANLLAKFPEIANKKGTLNLSAEADESKSREASDLCYRSSSIYSVSVCEQSLYCRDFSTYKVVTQTPFEMNGMLQPIDRRASAGAKFFECSNDDQSISSITTSIELSCIEESYDYLQNVIWPDFDDVGNPVQNTGDDKQMGGSLPRNRLISEEIFKKQSSRTAVRGGEELMALPNVKNTVIQGHIKSKHDHIFQSKYFREEVICTKCQHPILMAKEFAYKCQQKECNYNCHEACIDELTEEENCGAKQAFKSHDFIKKTHIGLITFPCAATGETIYPFNTYHECKTCGKTYKKNNGDAATNDCIDPKSFSKVMSEFNNKRFELSFDDLKQKGETTGHSNYFKISNVEKNEGHYSTQGANAASKSNTERKLLKDLKISKFRQIAKLGEGSYGEVVLAKHVDCKKPQNFVAIKKVRKDLTLETNRVADIDNERYCLKMGALPNVKYVLGALATFSDSKYLYFVMEVMTGNTLYEYVISQPDYHVPVDKVDVLSLEVMFGLEFLHNHGVIFRDLKLENVMVANDGHVRIIDFGFAKLNHKEGDRATSYCGSPHYMAPEFYKKQPYSFTVDVWAWAVLVFGMTEGRLPFNGNRARLKQLIVHQQPKKVIAKCKYMKQDTQSLLLEIMTHDDSKRLNAMAVIGHSYWKGRFGNDFEEKFRRGEHEPVANKIELDADPKNFLKPEQLANKLGDDSAVRPVNLSEDAVYKDFAWCDADKFKNFVR